PFFLHFKGGKGVAATAGIVIAFGDFRLIVVVIGLFFVIFFTTHIVSLASLLAYTVFCVGIWIFTLVGDYGLTGEARAELLILVTALTALAYYGHRGNIKRLAQKNERKTYLHRKEEKEHH
ncbi:MAG TPA: acyl-phosphate glycerol 3-phosphate acyltransferase, partial [Lachnospiraceae bacterium]|nr:acyl-phosphate glycerol 3-phosphate acyltransferase [Lachnospiraceae bacterium]